MPITWLIVVKKPFSNVKEEAKLALPTTIES